MDEIYIKKGFLLILYFLFSVLSQNVGSRSPQILILLPLVGQSERQGVQHLCCTGTNHIKRASQDAPNVQDYLVSRANGATVTRSKFRGTSFGSLANKRSLAVWCSVAFLAIQCYWDLSSEEIACW